MLLLEALEPRVEELKGCVNAVGLGRHAGGTRDKEQDMGRGAWRVACGAWRGGGTTSVFTKAKSGANQGEETHTYAGAVSSCVSLLVCCSQLGCFETGAPAWQGARAWRGVA